MTDISTTQVPVSLPTTGYLRKIVALIFLAALADWLFFHQPLGISIALFLFALGVAAVAANPLRASLREACVAAAVLVAGLAPLVVKTSLLAALFAIAAAAYASLTFVSPHRADWYSQIAKSFWLIVDAIWQAFADIHQVVARWRPGERRSPPAASLPAWIVPLLFGGIFVVLFTAANPLIENWMAYLDPRGAFLGISLPRIFFWLLVGMAVWPFIFMRGFSRLRETIAEQFRLPESETMPFTTPVILLDARTVVRSLIIFNVLFAVQTVLDVAYLWGGAVLPEGMSYATYAHRGAYPLIVTALLAAGFVLFALRPGSDTERWPLVRTLVFLWIGQNVLLVVSSMLRLDLYVAAYSLTGLRVAAFIWMGLVAVGLVLIVARIASGRNNAWLVKMNFAALGIVLYVCCFVNFAKLIADYNVAHSQEVSGQGVRLDTGYLLSLGPQALPALDRHINAQPNVPPLLVQSRNGLAERHLVRMRNWRAWSHQDWQLERYLEDSSQARAAANRSADPPVN
jgi:hypothetical protein